MRLTKLYIHNYKSFYNTTIELNKLSIFVGENNSGKSNLIDVLEFLDIAMTEGIEKAISNKGGYDKIKNYNCDNEKVIVRATFNRNNSNSSFVYLGKLDFNGLLQGEGEFTLSFSFSKKYYIFSSYIDMKFKCIQPKNKQEFKEFYNRNHEILATKRYKKVKFVISNKKYFDKEEFSKNKLFIYSKVHRKFIESYIYGMIDYIGLLADLELNIKQYSPYPIEYISTYYFNPENIKNKSNQENIVKLKKDGSNLGKNLHTFKNEQQEFDIISNSLIGIVNEINGIEIYEVAGSYIIAFQEVNKEININIVSDGTINLIATITALNQPLDNSFLLAFEEPERHLHLKAVNYLLDAFRNSNKQILITTHSTEILKYANLNEVIFMYRNSDGDTQTIRADKIKGLKRMMKRLSYKRDLTLDELIESNIVGDFE